MASTRGAAHAAIDAARPGAYHGAMTRLRSDFWVSAHLRRLNDAGVPAVLRRRGSAEAGAIFVKVDRLDGSADLFGPAPQALFDAEDSGERRFSRLMAALPSYEVEERLTREMRFDSDLWIVEIDDAQDRHALPLAE
ncbi:hypothetical protein SAMN04488125_102215 [Methylorubrum salsuginis]|uniref:DUF1491 domain-containing protein n=2 Tax=Methylorubrum salsuginis TaxID=414703 RepID=A0A1I4A3B3_9HYPH|nr:hypothetical protein SAMN04488125_102215 [Methylorubrum salsuginis]